MKEIYILSYFDSEFTTEIEVFTNKLQALNAFHKRIEVENGYLAESDHTAARFLNESVPEDDVYEATCFTHFYDGKIELTVKEVTL